VRQKKKKSGKFKDRAIGTIQNEMKKEKEVKIMSTARVSCGRISSGQKISNDKENLSIINQLDLINISKTLLPKIA
jgi:co-chaperonin GroES (HSP10)